LQNLLIAAGDFNLIEVQHFAASSFCWNADPFNRSTSFAKASLPSSPQKCDANTALKDSDPRLNGRLKL
jgi:hypothetical protein